MKKENRQAEWKSSKKAVNSSEVFAELECIQVLKIKQLEENGF